jgi:hypothetical protein
MDSPDLVPVAKDILTARQRRLNPVILQQEVHRAINVLMEIGDRKQSSKTRSLAAEALEE